MAVPISQEKGNSSTSEVVHINQMLGSSYDERSTQPALIRPAFFIFVASFMWFTVYYTIPGSFSFVPLYISAYAPDKETAMNQIERLYPECVPYDAVAPEPFVKRSRV